MTMIIIMMMMMMVMIIAMIMFVRAAGGRLSQPVSTVFGASPGLRASDRCPAKGPRARACGPPACNLLAHPWGGGAEWKCEGEEEEELSPAPRMEPGPEPSPTPRMEV